ncbi:MAG: hypothetical protein U9R29_03860 [Thermodesulfobacteriota bacterium]|nr:hypothetical protein [Thermodesulfobacteriota bacterium]
MWPSGCIVLVGFEMGIIKNKLATNDKLAPKLFGQRVVIEWCEDVHVHFRNLRFELGEDDFLRLSSAMAMARNSLWKWHSSPDVCEIPIGDIEAYDEGHVLSENKYGFWCGSDYETQKHYDGIEFWLSKLNSGAVVPPILVVPQSNGRYMRMDGFKRFIAMSRFGLNEIPCVVDRCAIPGGQENIEWSTDGKSFKTFLVDSSREPFVSLGEKFELLSMYTFDKKVPFEGRTQVELQADGSIHLHYNNLRTEFRFLEYLKFAFQIVKSLMTMPFLPYVYKSFFLDVFRTAADYIFKNHRRAFMYMHPKYLSIKKYFS